MSPRKQAPSATGAATPGGHPPANDHAERLLHELQVHQVELIQQNEELRAARAEIEAGLARYTDLYEFAPVAYFTVDADGVVLTANLTASQLLEVPRIRLRGRRLQRYIVRTDIPAFDRLLAELQLGNTAASRELKLSTEHGHGLIGYCVGSFDATSGTCRLAVLDVTAQRHAEESLRIAERRLGESRRLEALGRLAGGVAHNFNNSLMAINGTAELLEESLAEDDPRRADAQVIRESGDHAAALVRQLLVFGRRQTLGTAPISANEVMRSLGELLHRTLGGHINLVLDLGADVGPITVDPAQLEHVVLNLALNARDAMPTRGTLTISLAAAQATPITAAEHLGVSPGPFVRLSVTDTGTGIPSDVLPHLFEPFFTTKDVGQGTGLGLSTVEGFAASYGGWVEVVSAVGRGSTFSVFLPVASAPPVKEAPAAPVPRELGGSETILYVEDDDAVRPIGVRMLQSLGYTVIVAENPAAARKTVGAALASVQLLVTDVVMPGMNGPRLAALLSARRPGLPVLYLSGLTPDDVLLGQLHKPHTRLLTKPFTRNELASAIRKAIDLA